MPTIALVDDDRNILTSVSLSLEAEGYRIQTYTDGASALEGLKANPPDLAIFDRDGASNASLLPIIVAAIGAQGGASIDGTGQFLAARHIGGAAHNWFFSGIVDDACAAGDVAVRIVGVAILMRVTRRPRCRARNDHQNPKQRRRSKKTHVRSHLIVAEIIAKEPGTAHPLETSNRRIGCV